MNSNWAIPLEVLWVFLWLLLEPQAENVAYKLMKRQGRVLPDNPLVSLGWWPIIILILGLFVILFFTVIL